MDEIHNVAFWLSIFLLNLGLFGILLASRRFRKQFWIHFTHNHAFTLLQLFSQQSALGGLCALIVGLISIFIAEWDSIALLGYASLLFILFLGIFCMIVNKWPKTYYINPNKAPDLTIQFPDTQKSREARLFEEGFRAVYRTLGGNLIPPIYKTKSWFAIPGSKYPAAYLWDSSFISEAWRLWDTKIAQEILRPFLDHQRKDGMCPQTVVFGAISNYSITNPPLLSVALVQSAIMDDDHKLCIQYYMQLQQYESYIEKNRQDMGLFKWIHSYESGIDNSPRFTNQSESEHYDLSHLWAIDFNVYMVLHYQAMRQIADWMQISDDVKNYDQKIDTLVNNLQKYLWDKESGLFYDYNYQNLALLKIKTIFSTFPLMIRSLLSDQKEALITHLLDPTEFNTLIPFPTVARNDVLFQKDTWRGPVWINTAWIPLQGLLSLDNPIHQGKADINKIADMAYRLVKGVYETFALNGSFYEFYDPDGPGLTSLNRKKGNLFKKITLGDKPIHHFCGWTALINTIFIEHIFGYHRLKSQIRFCPHLPTHWLGSNLILTIPQFHERMILESKEDNSLFMTVEHLDQDFPHNTKFHGKNHYELKQDP